MVPAPENSLPLGFQLLSNAYNLYLFPLLPQQLQWVCSKITPVLAAFTESIAASASQGDYWGLFFTVFAVFIGFYVLNGLRRYILSWIAFFVRLGLVASLVAWFLYAYQVGIERAIGETFDLAEGAVTSAWSSVEDTAKLMSDKRGWQQTLDAVMETYVHPYNGNYQNRRMGVLKNGGPVPGRTRWR